MKDESVSQYDKTPAGYYKRWQREFDAVDKIFKKPIESGEKVYRKYLSQRENGDDSARLNLFHSSVNTVNSMLYGQVPKIDFDRRNADPSDDVARVAGEICTRVLNADVERPDDDYTAVLRNCLLDRLIPGIGMARVRYEAEVEDEEIPPINDPMTGEELAPGYTDQKVVDEKVPVDYVHWKDVRWGYARTWNEVPWVAFRTWMDYDALKERFGEEIADKVPLKSVTPDEDDTERRSAWQKGEIWEIWCKKDRRVYWWSKGVDETLDDADDPLQLSTFYPCPRPLLANPTTNLLIYRSDYVLLQDQYEEIDNLHQKISTLTAAVRVVGVYDSSSDSVGRILNEGQENTMIPVDSWAAFAEKKGLSGVVDWFPLEHVVAALDKLRELRDEQIRLLYQVSGLSDILRGQSSGSDRVSATEQSLKAKFASVRVQAMQDEFARFGTDLIRLKGEVMAKHMQPEAIAERANIPEPDSQLVPQAIELIRNQQQFIWRIHVRPESMAMVDYQQLQSERGEYLNGLAVFLQSASGLIQTTPQAMPYLLELLRWGLAGFKGAQQLEGVLDRAIDAAMQPPPQQEQGPSPEEQKAQVEMQAEQMKAQMAAQAQNAKIQADQMKAQQELMQDQQAHMQEMQHNQEKFLQEMAILQQKLAAQEEQARVKKKMDSES